MPWATVANIKGAPGANGAPGPPGPSEVSADGGNLATLGTDDLVYVPGANIPRMLFVNVPPHQTI